MERKLENQLQLHLQDVKKKIIDQSSMMRNLEVSKWALVWQKHDTLEMPKFPANQMYFLGLDPMYGAYFAIAIKIFHSACNDFESGELCDSLDKICKANFYLGHFQGNQDAIEMAKHGKAEKAQEATREKRRLIIEFYLAKSLQNRANTTAAQLILDSKIIEAANKKWAAPAYKTLLSYASVIKEILKISDEIGPWSTIESADIEAVKAGGEKEGISPYATIPWDGDKLSFFEALKNRQLQYFIYSDLSTSASRKEIYLDLKNELMQLKTDFRRLK